MTQTTAERIRGIIDCTVEDFGLETEFRDTIASSSIIAAEIDALAAQLAEARDGSEFQVATLEGDLAKHRAQLVEARAQITALTPKAEAWDAREEYAAILLSPEPDDDWDIRLRRAYNIREAAAARAREASK